MNSEWCESGIVQIMGMAQSNLVCGSSKHDSVQFCESIDGRYVIGDHKYVWQYEYITLTAHVEFLTTIILGYGLLKKNKQQIDVPNKLICIMSRSWFIQRKVTSCSSVVASWFNLYLRYLGFLIRNNCNQYFRHKT